MWWGGSPSLRPIAAWRRTSRAAVSAQTQAFDPGCPERGRTRAERRRRCASERAGCALTRAGPSGTLGRLLPTRQHQLSAVQANRRSCHWQPAQATGAWRERKAGSLVCRLVSPEEAIWLPNVESSMIARGVVLATSLAATAVSSFTLGVLLSRRDQTALRAEYAAELQQIRSEIVRRDEATATSGETAATVREDEEARRAERAQMVAEIKEQLQQEMGLLPVRLLRDRRSSFVELYADDNLGKTNYGTAGYLGHGYFITVKHAVVPLKNEEGRQPARRMVSIRIIYKGKEVPARVVDAGDAKVEVDKGDWAVIKTRDLDLPPLQVDTTFPYEFAEPIFRLGNDYSKGIVVSTGYVGQKTPNGLV